MSDDRQRLIEKLRKWSGVHYEDSTDHERTVQAALAEIDEM